MIRGLIKPMLATLVEAPFDNPDWIYEIKWDGYRAIAQIEKGQVKSKVQLYSRNGLSFNDKYPEVVKALKKLKHNIILDGEIVALDKRGRSVFELLQNAGEKTELNYVVFDILYLDGRDLTKLPLLERKKILKTILPRNGIIKYSDHIEKLGVKFFEKAKKATLEGIMAKNKSSIYKPGERSKDWQKIKISMEQEAVIGGFTAPKGSRKLIGALVLGVYENGKLIYIGHTGGGFDEAKISAVYKKLKPLISSKSPFEKAPKTNAPVTWVKPKLVCEVKFENWTNEGHMRQPIFLGLREDKDAKEVIREVAREVTKEAFSHLDKVFWPDEGYTKGDVINYYDKMAKTILPYLIDRPESLNRHPDGIKGINFYHKNITIKTPPFVKTASLNKVNYLVCNNKETLLYMANLGCIEINPWASRLANPNKPDFLIIDLDPGTVPFEKLIGVAKIAHEVLELAKIPSFIKTSGKKGMHIAIPMGSKYTYEEVRLFAEIIVRRIHEKAPKITSLERHPAKRKNKVYLDYLQNGRGQTLAAPYSLRPWPGATVSTPLKWNEVKPGLHPSKFTIETIFPRLKKYGDLWKPVLEKGIDMDKSLKLLNRQSSL